MYKRYPQLRLSISLIFLLILSSAIQVFGQSLSGYVYNQKNKPIPGVQIYIASLERGGVTNAKGFFKIDDLPQGTFAVQFSDVGFSTKIKHITIGASSSSLQIVLKESNLELPGLTVTGTPQATDALSSSQSVVSINQKQFQQNSDITAMSALENQPGVSLITTGNDVAKPVIHGLNSQRVLVMVNGVQQDAQNWGGDHGPVISPFQVNHVEVVEGPSSVLYGAGALGGVVNVLGPSLPTSGNGTPELGGDIYLQGFSNNNQGAGDIALHGASGRFGYRAELSHRTAGDINTPDGSLSNSGFHMTNGSFMVGTTQPWGTVSLNFDHFYQHLQVHDVPPSTAYAPLSNNLLHLHANIPTKDFRLEVQAGYQTNDRRDFNSATASEPDEYFKLHTETVKIQAHHNPIGPVYGTIGVSTMIKSNRTPGPDKLIPAYNMQNFAGFIYEKAHFGVFDFSAGGRFDTRNLSVLNTPGVTSAADRKFHAFSGALGAVAHLTSNLSWSANLGRAWRAPEAFELYAEFAHEGTYQYDIGNRNLVPETATNVQTSLKWIRGNVVGKLTVYNNAINEFIYGDPTDRFDPASGYRIYYVKQANARLRGLDASLQTQVTNWLSLEGSYSMVRGENLKLHQPLPFIPADHGYLEFKLQKDKLGVFRTPHFSFQTVLYAKQDRLAPHEPKNKGYTLANVFLGSGLNVEGTTIRWDLIIKNLFNKAYISHLSRYRDLPSLNPGRNIMLKIQIPFNLIK
ncbi:MAG TPA: TonB-dependent receptor [Balneolales bacterium]|nr:TonB-dependent receptor [Balneolales bacterium]